MPNPNTQPDGTAQPAHSRVKTEQRQPVPARQFMSLAYKDKYIRNRKDPISFIQTKDSGGRDCYYFVLASQNKIDSFTNSTSSVVNLNDYGIIIASGWGHNPSEEIKHLLKKKYNYNADTVH